MSRTLSTQVIPYLYISSTHSISTEYLHCRVVTGRNDYIHVHHWNIINNSTHVYQQLIASQQHDIRQLWGYFHEPCLKRKPGGKILLKRQDNWPYLSADVWPHSTLLNVLARKKCYRIMSNKNFCCMQDYKSPAEGV